MSKYNHLSDEELIRVARDTAGDMAEELCKRLAAALDKIRALERQG